MAIYSTDVELGVTTGIGLVTGFAAYIENADGVAPSDSLTDITSALTGNRAQLTTNTGSLTARNLDYYCSTFQGGNLTNSSPITFENCSLHIGESVAVNLSIPMTFTNVDIFNTCLLYTSPSPRDS